MRKVYTHGSEGFTLIEIMIVLIVLGILGAFTAYKFFNTADEAESLCCEHSRELMADNFNRSQRNARFMHTLNETVAGTLANAAIQDVISATGTSCTYSTSNLTLSRDGYYTVTFTCNNGHGSKTNP